MSDGLGRWLAGIAWPFVYALVFISENVALLLSLPEIGLRAGVVRPLRRLLARLSAAQVRR
jgi:hypothetical protein